MAAPNLVSNATVTGKSAGGTVGTSLANTVANAAASGTFVLIRTFVIANIHASSSSTIEASWYDGTNDRHYIKNATLAPGYSLTLECPIYLEEGQSVRLNAGTGSVLEWAASYEVWS